MKKIELNAPLRFVLVILIWLLTFTVVNLAGTLNNVGSGLIGTLVIYGGVLFLAFGYFNDCALKKACKFSLLVMVILVVCYLLVQSYGYILSAFEITNKNAIKANTVITNVYLVARNVAMAVCLIITLVKACGECECDCKCDCNKEECCNEETKEVEAPKENKKAKKEEK